jgi:opacity protein-like surface antigen
MKKVIVLILLALPLLSNAQNQPFEKSEKDKTTFLPVLKKGYRPQFGVSLVGGVQNNQNFDKSAPVFGVDISLQCPLLCTKKNYIRQQISIIQQNGKDLKTLALELNPQYRLISKPSFELGVGPSFGVIFAEANNDKNTAFTYGLGASIAYHLGKVFFTAESRYGLSNKIDFTDNKDNTTISNNLNNLRSVLKIGYKF